MDKGYPSLRMETMNRFLISEPLPRRVVHVGNVVIGGNAAPVVQSMTNTDTHNVKATLTQIIRTASAGAAIMRVAVPNKEAVKALPEIIAGSPVPIVADIHFDYRLAISAIEAGAHKIRINPGNIGSKARISAVVRAASDYGIPIRVGVNAGSLERKLLQKYGRPTAKALVESALQNTATLEDMGFNDIVISIKGSDVPMTVRACFMMAEKSSYPQHIGITEAGTLMTGAIRSSVGVAILLAHGVGDTIRVSLAADPVDEVKVACRILQTLGIKKNSPTVIACPTCGRTNIDVITLADAVENALEGRSEPLTVAVMGCAVNGPGEAREADIGVAGGKGEGLLFRRGNVVRKVDEKDIITALLELFDLVADELRCERAE